MEPVTAKLKRTRLFAQLSEEALKDLIAVPGVESGATGEAVITEPGDLVVLLEGGLTMTSADAASSSPPSPSATTRATPPSSTPSRRAPT